MVTIKNTVIRHSDISFLGDGIQTCPQKRDSSHTQKYILASTHLLNMYPEHKIRYKCVFVILTKLDVNFWFVPHTKFSADFKIV